MDVIAERKAQPRAERSYVVSLLDGGVAKIGGKILEEAAEVVEAADEPGESGESIWSTRWPTLSFILW